MKCFYSGNFFFFFLMKSSVILDVVTKRGPTESLQILMMLINMDIHILKHFQIHASCSVHRDIPGDSGIHNIAKRDLGSVIFSF